MRRVASLTFLLPAGSRVRVARPAVGVLAAVTLLTGCGSHSMTLTSRPTDLSSARDLAQLVADKAHCDGFEDYSQGSGFWSFTCQTGDHSYEIRAVDSPSARTTSLKAVSGSAAVKAGQFFLVTEAVTPGRTNVAADLAAFPGDLQGAPAA